MRTLCVRALVGAGLMMTMVTPALAQQSVTLADTTQTTTLTATVTEQARVTVPAGVTFTVGNVAASTNATAASVAVQSIVLSSATKQLKVSVQANASSFTPPAGASTTWSAADVTWNAASWTNATGATGTLSNTAYNTVATCTADASDCSTTGLVFTLGANASVQRAGSHTLVVTWKFESIGS
jgi:hypothetical protein